MLGPGRVGQALARRWRESGCRLLGFHGGRRASGAAAVRFAGGRVLPRLRDLAAADVVLVAVPDASLAGVVREAVAADAVRADSLWLHASGSHDLAVLAPLQALGARVGSLHPLLPFPDAQTGYASLPGSAAGVAAARGGLRRVLAMARRAGLVPIRVDGVDRARYHAACALVANGLTTLCATAARWLEDAPEATALIESLLRGVAAAMAKVGAAGALTGPAARGDVATLRAHLRALAARPATEVAIYRTLMQAAAALAAGDGRLPAARARAVRALLGGSIREGRRG